jgi:hypothetical protein
MNPLRRHLSYANVVATLALVFAMSGGALAASHYVINSTKQINPKILKALKGRTGPHGAIGAAGAGGTAGAAGSSGATGSQGPAGSTGPSGISGYEVVEGPIASGSGSGINLSNSTAKCAAGKDILGGGFHTLSGSNATIFVAGNGPVGSTEWEARLTSSGTGSYTQRAFAICATVSS